MKLKRTPLALLVTALVLGCVVYIVEMQSASKQETTQTQVKAEKIFSFKEEDVQTLNLKTLTQTLAFVKTQTAQSAVQQKQGSIKPEPLSSESPKPKQESVWMMKVPEQVAANDGSVAYLLNLVATGTKQQAFTVPTSRKAEFGFDQPLAIVEVKLANQQVHRLLLGKPNFNRTGVYALVNPPADSKTDLSVVLVAIDFENAVTRSLNEWKYQKQNPTQKTDQSKPVNPE